MTLRRVDFWAPKPDRTDGLIAAFNETRSALASYDVANLRLLRIGTGTSGPANLGAGACFSVADFNSAEAYGDFLAASRSDETIQSLWAALMSETSPAIHKGTGLLRLISEDGAEAPDPASAVSLIRAWRIEPEAADRTREAGAVIRRHFTPLGGHRLVFRPLLANASQANLVVSISFPGWPALGAFLDRLDTEQELLDLRTLGEAPGSGARLLQSSIVSVIAA